MSCEHFGGEDVREAAPLCGALNFEYVGTRGDGSERPVFESR